MIIKRNIRPLAKPSGESLVIRVRLSYAGRTVDFYPGVTVGRGEWDPARGRVVRNPSAAKFNRAISRMLSELEKVMERYEMAEERLPETGELRAEWERMTGGVDSGDKTDVSSLIARFMREEGTRCGWTETTHKKFRTFRKHLDEFRPGLRMGAVTEGTLSDFISFMVGKGLRNSTVMKDVKMMRWFLGWAERKGLYDGDARAYRPRLKGGEAPAEVVFLTREELARVEGYEIPAGKNYLSRTRDLFLFSCYSGLRFSDCQALTGDMVRDGAIRLTTKKTDTPVVIQLNRMTKEILSRGELPRMSNQKANKYLHELLRLAGVDTPVRRVWFSGQERHEATVPKYEAVTFHAARRTFVTQGLALGIPPEVIIKWTGHSDTKGLKPYLDVVEELKRDSMSLFDGLVSGHEKDTFLGEGERTGTD